MLGSLRRILSLSLLASVVLVGLLWVTFWLSEPAAQTGKRFLYQEDVGLVNTLQYGSGLTSTTLQAAINGIGSSRRTLFLSTGTWVLSSNITVPANIRLWVPASSTVTINSGVTLTLYNDPIVDVANWYTGTGTLVTRGSHGVVYARDFGLKCDQVADEAATLNAAIQATPRGGILQLPYGRCLLSSQIVITQNITLRGAGTTGAAGIYDGTVLYSSAPSIAIGLGNATNTIVVNLQDFVLLKSGAVSGIGIAVGTGTAGLDKCYWSNLLVAGFSTGLQLGSITDSSMHGVMFNGNTSNVSFQANSTNVTFYNEMIWSTGTTFSALTNTFGLDGTLTWCRDCQRVNPCVGSGPGSWARRIGSAWDCVS